MEIQHERCAGMDISKRDVKVCVRTPGKRHRTFDKEISVWGATAGEVGSLTQLGADYSSRQNPGLARRRAVAQLTRLGYTVELTSIN